MSEIVECISWIVSKTCWSLGVFALFVAKRMADLFGLIFNILACLTIVRLPCMCMQFSNMDSWWDWRVNGFVHFAFFLIDIPFILMGLFMILITCGLILIPFFNDMKQENISFSTLKGPNNGIYCLNAFRLHLLVGLYFFRFICDVLCIPLAVICVLSWRSCIFINKLGKKNYSWSDWGWRKLCVLQCLQLLLDIPCIFIGFMVMITWRAPFLIKRVKERRDEDDEKWNQWRFEVFPEFFYIFVDLVCIICLLLTMLTWRAPLLINKLRHAPKKQWKIREIMVTQLLLVFVDLPCIFLCLDCVYYCMENSKLYQKLGKWWMENSSQLYLSSGNALHWLWLFITQFYCHFNPLETLSINLRHKKILVETKTRKVVENTKIYMQECRIPICWHTSHFSLLHHFSNSFSLPKAAFQTLSIW